MASKAYHDDNEPMEGVTDSNKETAGLYQNGDGSAVDEAPVFLNPEDAVEVIVDDDNVPMDDDEDDYDGDDIGDAAAATDAAAGPSPQSSTDMSRVKVASHIGPVYAVTSCLVNNDRLLCVLSGGGDDRAFLHSVDIKASKPQVQSIALSHAYKDTVSCVALNLPFVDDKTPAYAATGGFDGSIVVYGAETGQVLQTFEGPSDVEFLAFHPKGGSVLLVGSSTDATLWMFHVPLNRCLQVFVGHESSVTCGGFSPDGRWVLSGSADGTVRLWAPRTGVSKHVFRFQGGGGDSVAAGITCMSMSDAEQQLVMVGTEDGQAHVCHIGTKKVVASLRHFQAGDARAIQKNDDDDEEEEMAGLPMSVEAVGFSPSNPHWCATGGVDGVLKIWDLTTGQCRQVCQPPAHQQQEVGTAGEAPAAGPGSSSSSSSLLGGITRLRWHPTLPVVVTSTTLGRVHVWDARSGLLVHSLTGHVDVINDMSILFNPYNGSAIAVTAGEDHSVRVFELDAGAFSCSL
jgi:ribosome assembly protein SQT1